MKSNLIAHIDLSTGASGDKLTCALIEAAEILGATDREHFKHKLESMVEGITVTFSKGASNSISGTRMHVDFTDHHEHDHDHHEHRTWKDIEKMIVGWKDSGELTDGAANRALEAFAMIAEAEGSVHGKPADEVHFHEVGAIDSIVDIVGASYLIDLLGIERLYSTPLTVGYGTVDCAHGTLPVPAPATAMILEGMQVAMGPYEGEMTTPTGAALAKRNVTDWGPAPTMVPMAIGIGLGTRDIDGAANMARLIIGSRPTEEDSLDDGWIVEDCVLLQTNIDHISPEDIASCCEDLMSDGALDVWQNPIVMKKGRLAIELNVLVNPSECDATAKRICALTGTLGVRRTLVERTVAPRSQTAIDTEYGQVRYKVAPIGKPEDRPSWVRPEHDDVVTIARKTGMAYTDVQRKLIDIWDRKALGR